MVSDILLQQDPKKVNLAINVITIFTDFVDRNIEKWMIVTDICPKLQINPQCLTENKWVFTIYRVE